MLKVYKSFVFIVVLLTVMGSHSLLVFSNSKYNRESKYKQEALHEPALNVLPEREAVEPPESIDSLFKENNFDFSLNKLRIILPQFIQVTPESRIFGDIKCHIEGFLKLRLDIDATITGITLIHPGLARQPVYISDLSLKGKINWDHFERTLSFENLSLGRASVLAQISGLISYKNLIAMKLNMSLPETDIQKVLDALPYGLIPKIKGAMVLGTIGMDLLFEANPEYPKEFKFEPNIRVNNYFLQYQPAGIHVKELKSDYTQEIRKNGVIVRQVLLSKTNPDFVPYDKLGEEIREAILKTEDISFFHHNGFNLGEIREAIFKNLNAKGFVRGGSTISMQLAKNLFLNGERTLSRKLQEAILTYALEKELSKERIFEIYANIIEWGVDVYGIAEASQHYFSKTSFSLTAEEANRLALIIPNPQKRDFNKKDLSVLDNMVGQMEY
ncbi:MAG: Penicillin-binding protein [uncultured bacterium]|nr:MAG: Penicillin-binding protein [uncultured bacterium]